MAYATPVASHARATPPIARRHFFGILAAILAIHLANSGRIDGLVARAAILRPPRIIVVTERARSSIYVNFFNHLA